MLKTLSIGGVPVSYTHLDVYKRQVELRAHLRRIGLDVAAALSRHLGTQFGLFKVGICQKY